ncbi:NUDIX hydrolase [Pseudalkalibacillus berkeleyi]|uniref:NUDIX hydrolase n=1 Tax=Pseudalkalibacillus berkeleyi TaxID=1069813 RepID=A0ABS9GTJ1_9BACL|nr:NUDIX hydrolase [Pseudalkalibacillus berkeleyi]MCF6136159.1 NUDIX hydrolase [Pseudalkalibacillus berkeleyi]
MSFKPLFVHNDTTIHETKSGSLFIEEVGDASVAVVAIRGEDMMIVEQYRHQLEQHTYELPGGGLEVDEEPIEGAKRELKEETGIQAKEMVYLGTFHPQPYFINRYSHLFFTRDTLNFGEQSLDEDEQITVHQMPIDDVLNRIKEGRFQDGELGYAILLCKLKGLLKD